MATRQDRVHVTLFVPGTPEDVRAWGRALDAKGFTLDGDTLRGAGLPFPVKLEWIENDGSFGQAFSFGTAPAEQQRAIDGAPGALLIYLPADLHRERAPIATLVRALASCGALAVRVEESRLGYPVDRWLELVEGTDPWSLYRAVVVMLGNERGATTCGMHAFSLPDAHVAFDDGTDEVTANALLGALNVYQVAEDPVLVSGHTFAPDADTPRRVLRRWPDATYPPGHGCHKSLRRMATRAGRKRQRACAEAGGRPHPGACGAADGYRGEGGPSAHAGGDRGDRLQVHVHRNGASGRAGARPKPRVRRPRPGASLGAMADRQEVGLTAEATPRNCAYRLVLPAVPCAPAPLREICVGVKVPKSTVALRSGTLHNPGFRQRGRRLHMNAPSGCAGACRIPCKEGRTSKSGGDEERDPSPPGCL
jgi:hypothetical protein